MIYEGAVGSAHAWGEVPKYSSLPPRFGDRTPEIGEWRIRQVDDTHLSVTPLNSHHIIQYHIAYRRHPRSRTGTLPPSPSAPPPSAVVISGASWWVSGGSSLLSNLLALNSSG